MNHRTYLALAIPLIISTITTPLLGAVDTAVVGHLPDPAYIGGVAVGNIIFNTMYWLFGFLRVGTSGFAAQAEGAKNEIHAVLALARPFVIAAAVGITFVLLQEPIVRLSLTLMNPEAGVRAVAAEYFGIRIWGAPFTLMNYVILGWLMGMSRIKVSLMLQVLMNLVNIALALLFVGYFSWGAAGVATATLIAEITAFIAGLILIGKAAPFAVKRLPFKELFDPAQFRQMMSVNRDLFLRTVCLLTVFNLFTAKGASFGTEVLAANAVLIQIHYLMAYIFDGFSNASSILTGRAVGSKDERLYKKTIQLSCQWAILSSLFIAGIYYLCSEYMIRLFTHMPRIIDLADKYGIWIVLFPLSASFGIILYGIFTGATEAASIRNSMIMALAVYLIVQFVAVPRFHNHGLWLAFIGFSLGRSVFLSLYIPKLNRKLFGKGK